MSDIIRITEPYSVVEISAPYAAVTISAPLASVKLTGLSMVVEFGPNVSSLMYAADDMAEALKKIIYWMDQAREREGKTDHMIFPEAPEITNARKALKKAGVK